MSRTFNYYFFSKCFKWRLWISRHFSHLSITYSWIVFLIDRQFKFINTIFLSYYGSTPNKKSSTKKSGKRRGQKKDLLLAIHRWSKAFCEILSMIVFIFSFKIIQNVQIASTYKRNGHILYLEWFKTIQFTIYIVSFQELLENLEILSINCTIFL